MTPPDRAFVALGGNVGDRRARLEGGLARLASTPGVRLAAVSAAFENPPVGGPPQGDYWNAVAEVATDLGPRDLAAALRGIESAEGRVRGERWGPRTLDLDLLSHGDAVLAGADLQLPHRDALTRAFVLRPWAEIAPLHVVPGTGRTVLFHEARLLAREPAAFEALRRAAVLVPASAGACAPPRVLADRAALARWRDGVRGRLGFVPTMGALHEGHASLARRARAGADVVLASVFVNPAQFGPREDLARYPRTFEADLALLGREGVDAVYAPAPQDVYPPGFATWVEVEGPARGFEGAARPGHFRGVATVVAKLLLRARPDRAWFGRKDAQQAAVVARLAADLDLPTEVVVAPTVRDVDGLALSSRNRYLTPGQREAALALPRALERMRAAAAAGAREVADLLARGREVLDASGEVAVEYLAVVDPDAFAPLPRLGEAPALAVATIRVGTTRLLDNAWLAAPSPETAA